MSESFGIVESSAAMNHSLSTRGGANAAARTRANRYKVLYTDAPSSQNKSKTGQNRNKYNPAFACDSNLHNLISELISDYEAQSVMLQKLDSLRTSLSHNWNGEDGIPIEDESYINTKSAIMSTPGMMLKHWRLFPNTNGTLLLSPKDKAIAGISIGNDEFSYAAYVSDDKQISGKEPFDVKAFSSALKLIHRILGYV